jgi:plasmid stabilization system protein ParE
VRGFPILLPIFLLVAGCGYEPAAPPSGNQSAEIVAPPPMPSAAAPPTAEERDASDDAAKALRDYYALIETRDFEAAARMRSDAQADAKKLADNLKAYETYRAQVGTPGRPARGGDWLYVRVPVMITGSYKGGKSFGSAGSVTLRRSTAASAAPADRKWRVYS